MSFVARCSFFHYAKKWHEVEEIAKEMVAEMRLREHLAEELGEEDADDLLKVLKAISRPAASSGRTIQRRHRKGTRKRPPQKNQRSSNT
jgi:hypothetical protein